MHRFNLLDKLSRVLLSKASQDEFLKSRGLSILEKWLMPNPDESFPPYQVIECAMDVLERLPVQIEHLQDCNVAKVLQLYASGRSQTGKTMAARATHLLQRWQLTVYQLTYEYDEDEVREKDLRRKLEVLRNIDPSQDSDASVTKKDDELIRKAPNGRLIMYKSNFDFLEKPESH